MIIEDSIGFRELVRDSLLSQYPSMEIVEVGSGEEALERLRTYPPDLLFVDIHLPGKNGLEVTKRVRTDHQDMTIIIFTSYDLPEYREAAITYGANGFMGKDLMQSEKIFTLVKCHQEAKNNFAKPVCLQLCR
jgi:DNA-binding NarL/FixJ family response regulator